MDKIKPTDCYTVTDQITEYELDIGGNKPNGFSKFLERRTGMIVLTVEQYNKVIEDAKTEERQRLNMDSYEADRWNELYGKK